MAENASNKADKEDRTQDDDNDGSECWHRDRQSTLLGRAGNCERQQGSGGYEGILKNELHGVDHPQHRKDEISTRTTM